MMGENKDYITYTEEKGSINISEEVVAIIAAGAAVEVDGVAGLYSTHSMDIAELLGKKSLTKGVKIQLQDRTIHAEVYIMAEIGSAVHDIGVLIQTAVTTAIESTTGLNVAVVNVHVCGIDMKKDK